MPATAAYRRSQEPLADFIADCCTLDPDLSVPATQLREEYERWCKSEDVKHPLAGKAWGAALRALGCTDRRTAEGRRWDGIDVRPGDRESGDADGGPLREVASHAGTGGRIGWTRRQVVANR